MSYKFYQSGKSGASPWFLQRATGLILAIVMIFHYLLMHYNIDSGHTYEAVLARMQNPLYKMLQGTFVVLGLYHGIQGSWNVFRDFKMSPWLSYTLYGLLVFLGIGFGVLGLSTIFKF